VLSREKILLKKTLYLKNKKERNNPHGKMMIKLKKSVGCRLQIKPKNIKENKKTYPSYNREEKTGEGGGQMCNIDLPLSY